jgi:C-terminal processing protease CtpA/Prc
MRYFLVFRRFFIGIVLVSFYSPSIAQQYSAQSLQEDIEILQSALKSLHPGLYRYNDTIEIEKRANDLKNLFGRPGSLQEVYLAISQYLESVKCGHTYANYWNQPKHIQQALFEQSDKLPFTYTLVNERMIVEKNLSNDDRLKRGCEVLTMNKISISDILSGLLQYISTDGSNEQKKWADLQLTGQGDYEAIDIFLSLINPPKEDKYALEIMDLKSGEKFSCLVNTISREERKTRLMHRFNEQELTYDSLWRFEILENGIGYMKIGTFVTYKMSLNWKKFLSNAFNEMKRKEIRHFILDIRGNGGGMDQVSHELYKYLVKEPIELPSANYYVSAVETPAKLRSYLSTWENGFYNWGNRVKRSENGLYAFKEKEKVLQLKPTKKMYRGMTYLLIDGANSSATFYLARNLKAGNVATLVGQTTGGNLRGMNAGAILFLSLPNTKVEVDIPLISTIYGGNPPDAGLQPDILIEPKIQDVIEGKDTVLEAVKEMIRAQ